MTIRTATPADAPALLAIYANYIATPVTFAYELPTEDGFAWNIMEVQRRYPYLLAEEDGKALGYAYAHPLREFAAYSWDVELTIYLAPDAVGKGVGTRLYNALLKVLTLQGVRNAYGCVTSPNPASEALHEKLGFALVGKFHQTGYKAGAWQDVVWFEKQLSP
ncbi:MAG: N-acetyltransferase, partial [Oscillospiraceae bacterium]|nr:N-acetyltransferase [Oscillospiraceae bacterium]